MGNIANLAFRLMVITLLSGAAMGFVNKATVVDRTTGRSTAIAATVRLPDAPYRQILYLPLVTKRAP